MKNIFPYILCVLLMGLNWYTQNSCKKRVAFYQKWQDSTLVNVKQLFDEKNAILKECDSTRFKAIRLAQYWKEQYTIVYDILTSTK